MATRTTLVDRRLAVLVFEGIPGDILEETKNRHLRNKAPFHRVEEALLRADLTNIDLEAVIWLLQSSQIRRFARGVLDRVRSLGGQFAQARMTEVLGDETLESQNRDKVVKFWTGWHFETEEVECLTVAPSIGSEVVYLTDLVEGSLRCSYDKVDSGGKSVEEILASLPQVEGLRWIVGNTPTINRVLANHLRETGEYLLPGVYTWTTDEWGLRRLIVGLFVSCGVYIDSLDPEDWRDYVGLFALGVPD